MRFSGVGSSFFLFYRRQVVFIARVRARATQKPDFFVSISKVVIAFFCVCVLFLLIWMCNYVFLCNGDGVKGPGTRPNNQQKRRHLHLVHFRINDVPEYRLYYARWTQACAGFVVAHKVNKQFCNLLLYKNSSVINNIEISRSSLSQMRRRPMANVLHTHCMGRLHYVNTRTRI